MATIEYLSNKLNELSGEHMALDAAFESHREHCSTDKKDMKAELKGINGKLWAGLVLLVIQLFAIAGYLAVNGTPWVTSANAQTVLQDRGERK